MNPMRGWGVNSGVRRGIAERLRLAIGASELVKGLKIANSSRVPALVARPFPRAKSGPLLGKLRDDLPQATDFGDEGMDGFDGNKKWGTLKVTLPQPVVSVRPSCVLLIHTI